MAQTARQVGGDPSASLVVVVAGGLVGVPRGRRFTLERGSDPTAPFHRLVGLDGTGMNLVVCDADRLWPAYADEVRAMSGGASSVLAIVTSCRRPLTANLLAPLVVDPVTGAARQVVLEGSSYGTRHAIPATAHF